MTRYRYRATAYAMKIDHIIVYREPRPSRVSVDIRTGHANSVIAAGTVPRRSPKTTTPCMLRLGVFRTRHHERTKTRTLENIQAPKNGAKYTYVDEIRDDEGEHDEERGPVCGTPWVQAEDVCAEERAYDEGAEWQHRAEGEDELSRPSRGHSDTISKTPRSTRSG